MKRAVIFDLDGVLVRTDEYHYQSWVQLAAQTGVPFDRQKFDTRMRGLERGDALAAFLEGAGEGYSSEHRLQLATLKNEIFLDLISQAGLKPVPGAVELLAELRNRGVRVAVGSSSRNAQLILEITGLQSWMGAVVDGSQARGKPHPDIFLRAAQQVGVDPRDCVVVEDAVDGVEAALRANMAVVAIGPAERFGGRCPCVEALIDIDVEYLLQPDTAAMHEQAAHYDRGRRYLTLP